MRYYYYGNPDTETVPKENIHFLSSRVNASDSEQSLSMTAQKTEIVGDLVIEEDTVYEIDRECLKCRGKNIQPY